MSPFVYDHPRWKAYITRLLGNFAVPKHTYSLIVLGKPYIVTYAQMNSKSIHADLTARISPSGYLDYSIERALQIPFTRDELYC